jgi:hypothetical protein
MAKASTQTANKRQQAAPPPKNKSTAVTTTKEKNGAVQTADADEMAQMMMADAGKGVSTAMEDNIVPLVYILQPLSPQVQKKNPEYIEGAEAGQIWFRGSSTIVDGEEGIPVVPCHWSKCWIEWQPNRGGFVARHADRPADAVLTTDAENPKRKFWRRPNGNIVVETREHVVLVLDVFERPMPFVIPMSGSGHGSSRAWMSKMNSKFIPNSDQKAPSYGYIYRMKLQYRTNDQGEWYMWDVHDENDEPTMLADPATYKLARQLEADFSRGALRAQDMTGDQVDDSVDSAGSNAKGQRDTEHL